MADSTEHTVDAGASGDFIMDDVEDIMIDALAATLNAPSNYHGQAAPMIVNPPSLQKFERWLARNGAPAAAACHSHYAIALRQKHALPKTVHVRACKT